MTFAEAIDVILKQPGTAVHRKAWTSNKYLAIYGDILVIGCGEIVKKSLAVRIHKCPACGLVIDRDILAAKNILRFGQNLQALTKPIGLVA